MSSIPSLRDSLRRAEELGLEVKWLNRTGEVAVRDPLQLGGAPVRVNARKKDTPRILLKLLKRAAETRHLE
jgi:hypothetical protein